MLHITDKDDTLALLQQNEEFPGPLADYRAKFLKLNPHLKVEGNHLPPFSPVYLVSSERPPTNFMAVQEITRFSIEERKTLREVQDKEIEIPVVMAAQDLLKVYAGKVADFRKKLDNPIINTPWAFWNNNLTNDSILDIISEGALFQAHSIKQSELFKGLEAFERDMMKMDTLQTQMAPLMRGRLSSKADKVKSKLTKEINKLHPQIKNHVYPELETKVSKHLDGRYSPEELKKMTRKSFGEKMARKGKLKTTHLDLVNRTRLGELRAKIPLFHNLGTKLAKGSVWLGWASVGYDTLDAGRTQGLQAAVREATASSTGLVVGATVTTYLIGAAGSIALVSTPFGWALVIVGAVVAGNVAHEMTKNLAGNSFDYTVKFMSGLLNEDSIFIQKNTGTGRFLHSIFSEIGKNLLPEAH